jgi:hypothetical protein
MSTQDRILFNNLTEGIKLAVAKALEKIKNSSDPTIAISKDGKHIEIINLKDRLAK